MSELSCDLSESLRNIRHLPKKRCYQITLEVPTEIGARIMEFATMLTGLSPWDQAKLLDGGLRLTERGPVPDLAEHGCLGCGDDSRVCGCAE